MRIPRIASLTSVVAAASVLLTVPAAAASPTPDNGAKLFVDQGAIATPGIASAVEKDLDSFAQRTDKRLFVLLVKTTDGQNINEYTAGAFAQRQLGVNDSLLVIAKDDSNAQFQPGTNVNASADATRAILASQVVPRLSAHDPNEAVIEGETAMRGVLGDATAPSPPSGIEAVAKPAGAATPVWEWLVMALVIVGVAGTVVFNERSRWLGGPWMGYSSLSGWDGGARGAGGGWRDKSRVDSGGASGTW